MANKITNFQERLLHAWQKVLLAPKIILSIPKNVLEMGIDILEISVNILESPEKITDIPKYIFHLPSRVFEKVIKSYLIVNADSYISSFLQQKKLLFNIIKKAKKTAFAKEYHFESIKTIQDFQKQVPIFHYKDFEPWIIRMLKGKSDVSYPWKIDRFATSSGTTWWTSKFIPVTNENLKTSHFKWWLESLSLYIKNNPKSKLFQWKWLVIWWLFTKNKFTWEDNIWYISAILQKNSPWIGQLFKTPWPDISYIENREEKVQKTINFCINQNITSISGQPSWMSNLLQKMVESTTKENVLNLWPNLELFFWWWSSIALHKKQLEELIPSKNMKYYQIYNASEWYFATQDGNDRDDMLLLTDHGTFYEFIPFEEYGKDKPRVFTLNEVEKDKEYVIVISTTAWLRRYILGDVIKFTTLNPRRIQIIWRTKYFIDTVGERVTADHTDKAIEKLCKKLSITITDYMVGPAAKKVGEKCAHERILECDTSLDVNLIQQTLDDELGKITIYYHDERHDTKVLGEPIVHLVPKWTFYAWLKFKNKLWWQHKVPKVANDRKTIEEVLKYIK